MIAFSGGLDSSFLLKVASVVLPGERLLAVTAGSFVYPAEELDFCRQFAGELGVRWKKARLYPLRDKRFVSNPASRCYICKESLFSKLSAIAAANKIDYLLDAGNLSDRKDFRPGNRARSEFKVKSPLLDLGFTKEDIRSLSKKLGLRTWNKPGACCLATRIPYGVKITLPLLKRIAKAEAYLRSIGFSCVRLRHYNSLCRMEVAEKEIPRLIARRKEVVNKLKDIGYKYITVDLEGYRMGSMTPRLWAENE